MKRVPPLFLVSLRQVRHHLLTYLGLAVVVAVTTILAVAELTLVEALRQGQFTMGDGATPQELADVQQQISEFQTLLFVMLVITASIAVTLVASTARSVIYSRRVELRMFRLIGSSLSQLRQMLAFEFVSLMAAVSFVSAIVGFFVANPVFGLYKALGAFGPRMELINTFNPGLLGSYVVCQTIIVTAIGAYSYRERPYLAIPSRKLSHSRWRAIASWAVRCTIFASAVVVLFATTNSTPEAGQIAVLLPLLVTAGMVALSPILIPGLTRVLALLVQPISPGISRLVAATAWGDRARLTQVSLPMVVAVGLLGGFMYASTADAQVQADTLNTKYQYKTQVDFPSVVEARTFLDHLHADGDTSAVMVSEPITIALAGQEARLALIYASDSQAYVDMMSGEVTEGDLGSDSIVGPSAVASVGDVVVAKIGKEIQSLTVDVAVSNLPFETFILPMRSAENPIIEATGWRIYSARADNQLEGLVRSDTTMVSKAENLQDLLDKRLATSLKGNVSIFGTIYVMCFVALLHIVTTSTSGREGEFTLLRRVGLSRASVISYSLTEMALLAMSILLLLSVLFILVAWKFSLDLGVHISSALIPATPTVLLVHAAVSTVALGLTLGASIRSTTTKNPGKIP